jgi:hypothetical protein
MFTVILRSAFVGLAAVVAATFVGFFIALPVTLYFLSKNAAPEGGGEIGWDLVSLYHNTPSGWLLLPLLVFAIGFYFGFRYFSKSLAAK